MKSKLSFLPAAVALLLVFSLVGCGAAGGAPSMNRPPAQSYTDAEEWPAPTGPQEGNSNQGERYLVIDERDAVRAEDETTVTLSLKVDTGAYTNVARYIQNGSLPPKDAVRTEEMINYFSYDQDLHFDNDSPFAVYTEVGPSPFNANRHMAFIRLKTRDIPKEELPPLNLTFLIDTSGSMSSYDKLPLLQEAFSMLVETLDERDTVSIVAYAGSSGVVLDSANGTDQAAILSSINRLAASGSTAGGAGIQTAYRLAEKNFVEDGNNRVILASDGDFNVGISDPEALGDFIAEKRGSGVYLSVLGFGTGNIRDDIMETLAKHGNGNYSYIDSSDTAYKVLVEEMGSNLFTVADDVKTQVEFFPEAVKSYRLIGYENRILVNRDFDDDTKDAGEIGVGTDVVMLFEVELANGVLANDRLFDLNIRYKNPGEARSNLVQHPVYHSSITENPGTDYRFACSVAVFGHLLRGSEYRGDATLETANQLAKSALGKDEKGYRLEYLLLLQKYQELAGQ